MLFVQQLVYSGMWDEIGFRWVVGGWLIWFQISFLAGILKLLLVCFLSQQNQILLFPDFLKFLCF